jgi:hypothetical protein
MSFVQIPDAVQCSWLRYMSASSIFRMEVVSRQCRRVVIQFQRQHVLLDRVRDWLERHLSYGHALCEMLRLNRDLAAQFVLCGSCPLQAINGEDWGDDDADCDFWTTSVIASMHLRQWLRRHHKVSDEDVMRRDAVDPFAARVHTLYDGTGALNVYNFQVPPPAEVPNVREDAESKRQQQPRLDRALQIITVSRAADAPTDVSCLDDITAGAADVRGQDADESKQEARGETGTTDGWPLNEIDRKSDAVVPGADVAPDGNTSFARIGRTGEAVGGSVDAVRDVMSTFDWDWCKCAWSPNRLTIEGKAAIRDRRATMRREFRKPSAGDHANMMRRLMRFARRGYHGTVSNLVLMSLLEPASDSNPSVSDHVRTRLREETDRYRTHLLLPINVASLPSLSASLLAQPSLRSSAYGPVCHGSLFRPREPIRPTSSSPSLASPAHASASEEKATAPPPPLISQPLSRVPAPLTSAEQERLRSVYRHRRLNRNAAAILHRAIEGQGVTDSEIARRLRYLRYPEDVRDAFRRRLSWMPAVPYGRCYRTSGAELTLSRDSLVRQVNIRAIIDRAFDIAEMVEQRVSSESSSRRSTDLSAAQSNAPATRRSSPNGRSNAQRTVAEALLPQTATRSTNHSARTKDVTKKGDRDGVQTRLPTADDGEGKKRGSVAKRSRERKGSECRTQMGDTNVSGGAEGGGGGRGGGSGSDLERVETGERDELDEDDSSITLAEIESYEREHVLQKHQISIDTRVARELARKRPRTRRAVAQLAKAESAYDIECAEHIRRTRIELAPVRDRYALWPIGADAAHIMEHLWSLTWKLHVHLALGIPDETHRVSNLPPTSCPSLVVAHAIYCARSGWCPESICDASLPFDARCTK